MKGLSPQRLDSVFSSLVFLCLFIMFLLCCENGAGIVIPKNKKFPALFLFGDSLVDPGNNNHLATTARCNFPPYGRDFKYGPTGRFGNGKVASDLIAEELGIKELLPAYLDPTLGIQDLLTGVSFASGGSGYDPLTSQLVSALSVSDQLELFRKYIEKLKTAIGENRTSTILSKSAFLVFLGTDDIANTYFGTPFRRIQYSIPSYTDLMVKLASSFFKDLYGLGARRIGVIGLPPIGCLPSQRTLGGGLLRGCAESRNQAAMLFNSKLSSELNSLRKKLPQAKLVYLDIYNELLALIQHPFDFGFEEAKKGCCGTGTIEASILCTPLDPTCVDRNKYVFWDSYHPTEKASKIIVSRLLSKHINDF